MQGELYRQICETSNEGIWVIDADARTLYVNAHLAELLGHEPAEMLGKSLFDFVFPEDGELFQAKLEARKNGSREQCDLRFRRRDGSELWAIVGANPLFDADGQFRGVFALITDVTERRFLDRQREHAREALRSFFEFNPEAVYVLDPSGNLTDVNPAAERLTGYSREELLAMSWQPVVAPEHLERGAGAMAEALSGREVDFELTIIHRDGRRIPVAGSSFPLKTNGDISGVYGVVRDVSRRKRMEDNLQLVAAAGQALSSSLNYQETLDRAARITVPVLGDWCIVATAGEPGQVEVTTAAANPATELQLKEIEALAPDLFSSNSPLARLAVGADVELFENVDDALLAAVAGNPEAAAIFRKLAPSAFVCAPLRDHGRRRGVLLLARSPGSGPFTPEQLELTRDLAHLATVALENAFLHQELRRADTNKDQFLTTLGHELRNPLAAMRSGVEVLRRCGTDSVRGEHALRSIERQIRHEARLLEDLLNVARIARGKVLMRFEPVELTQLLSATLDDYRDALEENGLAMEIETPGEPVWVTGDPTRLAQVFANLLHNAIKFTDKGGAVRVSETVSEDGHWTYVSVADTGVGMEPGALSRLFEMFTQGDRTRERSRGGLGLGLALVKGLVEIHGGEVAASSPGPGHGACFMVTLPRQAPPEPARGKDRPTVPERVSVEPHRVLVVDDNQAVAESLSELLQLMGYEVQMELTGPDGVRAAGEFRPHAVLCDLGLPGLNGYQVAASLRSEPGTADTLLIALTGEGSEGAASHALAAGFDHFLLKPFEPAELQRLLDASLLGPSADPS